MFAYATLSVFCLAEAYAWSTLCSTLSGLDQVGSDLAKLIAVLLGPPAFLLWGIGAWPWYVVFTTLVVGGLLSSEKGGAIRRSGLKLLVVLVWLGAGVCSASFAF